MRIKETLIGLLYPKRCPVCHDVVEDKGELVCRICRTKLPLCGSLPAGSAANSFWKKSGNIVRTVPESIMSTGRDGQHLYTMRECAAP